VNNFAFFYETQCGDVDQAVVVVAFMVDGFATEYRDAKGVGIVRNAQNDIFFYGRNKTVWGGINAKMQAIEYADNVRTHTINIADNAAYTRGGAFDRQYL
jgi:hypothetical protein